MSGQWPPEWEDPEEEYPGENDQLDATVLASGGEARLSEVAAFLAALPAPAMPDAVEARISAALATEARASAKDAGRAGPAGPAEPADGARTLDTSRRRPRAGRHRGGGPRRDGTGPRRTFRVRPSTAAGSLVAILLVAGLGFGLSRATSSSSSSSAASGSVAVPAAGEVPSPASSSAAAAGSGAAGSSAGGFSTAGPEAGPTKAAPGAEPTVSPFFAVTVSGTNYEEPTLAAQVRGKLAPSGGKNTFAGTFPAPTTNPRTSVTPSPALRGCVLHFTNGAAPRLVDRATYNGQPAYVIASSTHVWVVGLGCTAANPELVTQVPLAG
jgi:hypothetical protein